jgi:hypothetical protein
MPRNRLPMLTGDKHPPGRKCASAAVDEWTARNFHFGSYWPVLTTPAEVRYLRIAAVRLVVVAGRTPIALSPANRTSARATSTLHDPVVDSGSSLFNLKRALARKDWLSVRKDALVSFIATHCVRLFGEGPRAVDRSRAKTQTLAYRYEWRQRPGGYPVSGPPPRGG